MSKPTFIVITALLVGCGGNYSNEDVDFQLALPEREDLSAKLPVQALELADASEYYKHTRKVVKTFNGISDGFLSLIDHVRMYPPSQRDGARRVWGPFPNEQHPEWAVRVVITRGGDPDVARIARTAIRFDYSLEFRPAADPNAPWKALITGFFNPNGGIRRGSGQLFFTTAEARAAGYPVDTLVNVDHLTIGYQTMSFPASVDINMVAFPTGAAVDYHYLEQQDGSGQLTFSFPTPEGAPFATALLTQSRWTGSGTGRADVSVIEGTALGAKGVDCWAVDTHATYVQRDWLPLGTVGNESTCAFSAP